MSSSFKISRSTSLDMDVAEWLIEQAQSRDRSFSSVVNEKLRQVYEQERDESDAVKSQ